VAEWQFLDFSVGMVFVQRQPNTYALGLPLRPLPDDRGSASSVVVRCRRRRGFTLVEVMLVVGLVALIAVMVIPNFMRQIRGEDLTRSAKQLRSFLTMVRANAAFDGKRYRVRFPEKDADLQGLLDDRQPIIEREDDPIYEPETFNPVRASWTVGTTFLGDVWCSEIRLGRPTIERLQRLRKRAGEEISEEMEERYEDFEPERLPLLINPDGSSEWAVFVLTTAPRNVEPENLPNYPGVELIADGATGLSWVQRPFYKEELDLFEEKGWPAVLRQDFVSSRALTEDDVLEIRETHVKGSPVEMKGREIHTERAEP
jgi:prepilin-type N-terminal cleavage/methylation domain-containing protein